ncbi:MAG TPA: type II toxin-antitoxin system prevent-host-death family antitoxin [Gammaproteobacteria bacterium]|jgi:antitoxin YefM|nr:type II toxin-antitoxin system prevent-host-death family antitoxin [Gammaproteobacteria bacterium]
MNSISYTAARSHLAKTMQQVCDDHAPVVITRSKSEPVVMISLSDFESMQETNYLMKSPQNAARLLEAMDEIEAMIETDKSNKKED